MRSLRPIAARLHFLHWAFADQVLVSGANFVANLMIIRFLGLEDYGWFALAWLIVLQANAQLVSWIVAPMASIGPKTSQADQQQYYSAVALLGCLFIGAGVVICAIASGVLSLGVSLDASRTALALSIALPLIQSHELVRRIRFIRHDERAAFFLDLLVYGMRLPGLWLAYDHGWISGAPDALVLMGLSSIPGLLAAARLLKPGGCSRAIIRDAVIRHWKISRWLSLSILLPWVTYYATSAGVAAFLGTAALGLIAATLNLVGSINVVYLAIGNVLPVRAARQFAKSGPAAMLRYLGHVAGWGGVLVACCLGVLAMFPDFWFHIFFARTDARAALLIRLWSLDYFFAFFIIPLQIGLTTLENTRPVFLAKLAAVALRAAAAGPLIWLTGVYGFVLAQSAGTATEAGVLSIRLKRGVANHPVFDTENSIRRQIPGESPIV